MKTTVLLKMNKTIIILASLVIVLAYTEASTPRCRPVCRKDVSSRISCVRDGSVCRKIRQCTIEEENCRRRILKRRRLSPISPSVCRNIKSPLGSGRCASIRKPRSTRPNCSRIRCTGPSKTLGCYRSNRNNCRLLTSCQLNRANCRRRRNNALRATDLQACVGLKQTGRRQRCRPITKKG